MTILHIVTSSKCWAGMEQYTHDEALGAIERGHKVVFVVRNDGNKVQDRLGKLGRVYELSLFSKYDLISIFALRKIIKAEKIDVVHTHQPKNIFQIYWALRGIGRKVLMIHTAHFELRRTSPHSQYSKIFDMPDTLIAVSEFVRNKILEVYPNLNPHKVITIHNSIDPRRLKHVAKRENKQFTIGFGGRIVPEKGVEVLIDAIAKLGNKEVRVVISGTGNNSYIEELKSRIALHALTPQFNFIGFVTDIGTYISDIDIGVVPSVWSEPIGLMLLEYMASGVAVVASNRGGPCEVIDNNKDGILFETGNSDALSEALAWLINDNEYRKEMGKKAAEKFNTKFSFPSFIDKILEVYKTDQ